MDSPSTPEELCVCPGSVLSASPCPRCLWRELSGPSPGEAAALAAAAAAAVPASGMLSISEPRRRKAIKIFSGKQSSGVAFQEEGRAWIKRRTRQSDEGESEVKVVGAVALHPGVY